ncbi:MAG: FAD-binding protein [Thermodesulfobacteriota bacterium]
MEPSDLTAGIASALSGDRIRTDAEHLAAFGPEQPAAVVAVRNAAELSGVVSYARRSKTPLFPVSSAPGHHTALAHLCRDAVVCDLSPMKRILAVNRRNRVILAEAGVCFENLAPVARSQGLRLMLPLLPRPGKSVLAAYLDREPTIYPKYQWDLSDPLLCLEAVYGTGDLFRTGSAAGPGTIEEQWAAGEFQKNPMGPGQNDWMRILQGSQGAIGISTWCSAKAEVKPVVETLYIYGSDSLAKLVAASYALFHARITDIHFIVDKNALSAIAAAPGGQAWNLVFSISGIEHFPEKRANYLFSRAETVLRGNALSPVALAGVSNQELLKKLTLAAPASAYAPHWRDRLLGSHVRVFFQTTLDRAETLVSAAFALAAESGIPAAHCAVYLQPQIGGRVCHVELVVAKDPISPGAEDSFAASAAGPLTEKCAFFSRPHGPWAGQAMQKTGPAFWVYQRVKDIFDPDHILAPGRLDLGTGN